MALYVDCSMCEGTVEANTVDIQREFLTCPYCSTVNRVTRAGSEAHKTAVVQDKPPKGVKVKRRKAGGIQIRVKGDEHNTYYFPTTPKKLKKWWPMIPVIIAGLYGLWRLTNLWLSNLLIKSEGYGMLAEAANFGLAFAPIFYLLSPIFFLLFYPKVNPGLRYLPKVRVRDGVLKPSASVDGRPLRVDEIQQLYLTATTTSKTGWGAYRYCNLYALTYDKEHVPVMNPIPGETTALLIKELLEIELGIFELPLYRDSDEMASDTATDSKAPDGVTDSLLCIDCATPIAVTSEARREGHVVCDSCNSITRLHHANEQSALGLPSLRSYTLLYKIIDFDDHVSIRLRDNDPRDIWVLNLNETEIKVLIGASAQTTLPLAEIETFFVKEQRFELGESANNLLDNAAKLWSSAQNFKAQKMNKVAAYATEQDAESFLLRRVGVLSYQIVAKSKTGENVVLLMNIDNLREAFAYIYYFNKYMAKNHFQ